jgi:hypothetical protein
LQIGFGHEFAHSAGIVLRQAHRAHGGGNEAA